ncbi:MAG: hypothetical protein AUJ49_10275 [Desulfovibrionaceae bacterium CG1_02_65_16]|nr:MAG: hypothetical protein AUJ49_10275 [Desulfovibrionaceae bacterium CG1_02_65_16]
MLAGAALALLAVGYLVFRPSGAESGLVAAQGRMEGDDVVVATKVAARVAKLLVDEGAVVTAGQVLAKLDDAQVRARLRQAQQALSTLEAQVRAARTSLQTQRRQVPLDVSSAQATLAEAEAGLAKAKAQEEQAGRDAGRYKELARQQVVEPQRAEQYDLAFIESVRARQASTATRGKAREQLLLAQLGPDRVRASEDQLLALEAQRDQAQAAVDEARSNLDDLTITAPSDGVVKTKLTQLGEVLSAGGALFGLVDLNHLYLKVYVPEKEIGRVRLGQPAMIYADALPGKPLAARVGYIASQAEFTPKEVQTRDERVKLVFAVKLYLDENPGHAMTPGLPADAAIRVDPAAPWKRPKW